MGVSAAIIDTNLLFLRTVRRPRLSRAGSDVGAFGLTTLGPASAQAYPQVFLESLAAGQDRPVYTQGHETLKSQPIAVAPSLSRRMPDAGWECPCLSQSSFSGQAS
jgi:hypothetical protein